jgi:hypothetical protein
MQEARKMKLLEDEAGGLYTPYGPVHYNITPQRVWNDAEAQYDNTGGYDVFEYLNSAWVADPFVKRGVIMARSGVCHEPRRIAENIASLEEARMILRRHVSQDEDIAYIMELTREKETLDLWGGW